MNSQWPFFNLLIITVTTKKLSSSVEKRSQTDQNQREINLNFTGLRSIYYLVSRPVTDIQRRYFSGVVDTQIDSKRPKNVKQTGNVGARSGRDTATETDEIQSRRALQSVYCLTRRIETRVRMPWKSEKYPSVIGIPSRWTNIFCIHVKHLRSNITFKVLSREFSRVFSSIF